MTWKEGVLYYLAYLDRHRICPLVERLSYLTQEPAYQDDEYQQLIRLMAEEA